MYQQRGVDNLIDLRSDTLTKPNTQMMSAITSAELGDDGRLGLDGKGEDPTVNELEMKAARLVGKEDALFCNSGTMANIIALLIFANRGEAIGLDASSHIFQSEKAIFKKEYFGRRAVFYESDEIGKPLIESIDNISSKTLALLCIENTFSMKGGTSLSAKETFLFCEKAASYHLPVHLDGARIFNAAAYLNQPVKNLVQPVTTIQFCLSKGLGAPVGSMLCGSSKFIKQARKVRKLLGGGMRQAGVIAAAGIEALNNIKNVHNDNEKALLLANQIRHHNGIMFMMNKVETNIIVLDLLSNNLTSHEVEKELAIKGLRVKVTSVKQIRLTIYKDITRKDINTAANIINAFFEKYI